jgi:transposase
LKLEFIMVLTPDLAEAVQQDRLMIDATHLKAHRTAASLLKKGAVPRRIGRTKGGLNSKLHAVCDGRGRPLIMLLSEGQMSDYKGAALMIDAFPKAKTMLGDKGHDADWFRQALSKRGIAPCIPSKANRKIQIEYDKTLYRQRHRIENVFGRLKDSRRGAFLSPSSLRGGASLLTSHGCLADAAG